MANLQFTQQDIKNLVNQLEPVMAGLSEQERMLLVAIFAAAANQTGPSDVKDASLLPVPEFRGQPQGTGSLKGLQLTVEELRRQLLDGYVPGKDLGTTTHSTAKVVGTGKRPGK